MCFAFVGPWGSNVAPWGSIVAPGAPFWETWATCCRFSSLFVALGLHFDTPGLHLVTLWRPFWCLFEHLGRDSGPSGDFYGKVMKKVHKRTEKEAQIHAFLMIFQVFPENGKVSFDCASASGLRFGAIIFCLFAVTFACSFCHRFCMLFGSTWEPRFTRPAAAPAPL